MPKPKMVKMSTAELRIWQKCEAIKRDAQHKMAQIPTRDTQQKVIDFWYERGRAEVACEIMMRLKLGEIYL